MRVVFRFAVRVIILAGFIVFLNSHVQAGYFLSEGPQEDKVLYIGYPASAFAGGILDEMKVALEVWGSKLAEKATLGIKEVKVTIFQDEDFSDIHEALQRKEIDLLIMNTLDYVEHEEELLMEPVFVGSSGTSIGYNYVLIVRQDSGIETLDQLQGNTIDIETEGVGRMPIVWLNVLLSNIGYYDVESFFKESRYVDKSSKAVLPVFFKTVPVCLTNHRAFRTMAEMNPQLERELRILEASPEFLRGVVAFRKDLEPNIKKTVSDALSTMHEDPDGQQILIVIQEQKLIPFKENYVESVKALFKEYRKLQERITQ